MVIDYLDLKRLAALFGPDEAHPILVVDPDRTPASPLAWQLFETVSRRRPHILEDLCLVDLVQFSPSRLRGPAW